ncbi:hypothetical protein ACTVR5_15890 [Serratia marcescens]|uniref:hypothetical protein n=1 Tax=Serratia marcescens TaxID=615 RepID=UPI0024C877D2|nr:hypothetical protein O3T10_03385 [Serratia marcescens]
MTNLGSLLGASYAEQLTDTNLRAGAVIYMRCDFTTPAKNKFLVVACCEPEMLVLVINSEINAFIAKRENLLDCQVDVPQADHAFLQYDSYVNCVETHTAFNMTDIRGAIIADYAAVYKGRLADYVIRNVIEAVDKSETMEPRYCRWIKDALTSSIQ